MRAEAPLPLDCAIEELNGFLKTQDASEVSMLDWR
jgi:hypothetical protein